MIIPNAGPEFNRFDMPPGGSPPQEMSLTRPVDNVYSTQHRMASRGHPVWLFHTARICRRRIFPYRPERHKYRSSVKDGNYPWRREDNPDLNSTGSAAGFPAFPRLQQRNPARRFPTDPTPAQKNKSSHKSCGRHTSRRGVPDDGSCGNPTEFAQSHRIRGGVQSTLPGRSDDPIKGRGVRKSPGTGGLVGKWKTSSSKRR